MREPDAMADRTPARHQAAVFAPSPQLTVTVERHADGGDEVHLHAGGQGFWIARLLRILGVDTVLCGAFGGETGAVVRTLVEREGVAAEVVSVAAANGAYVHDRRSGERVELARQPSATLERHDLDDLYAAALVTGMAADLCVLGGPDPGGMPVPPDTYRRLAHDLRENGTTVVVDLSGEPAAAALQGGVDVLKTSDEDLAGDGLLGRGASDADVVAAMRSLQDRGADAVVVTRADARPALALDREQVLAVQGPRLEALDHRGAGDSVTAGLAAGLVRGQPFTEALRFGVAAATLNVARHGLASGRLEAIVGAVEHVSVELATTRPDSGGPR